MMEVIELKDIIAVLKALGDGTRLRIIKLLENEPVCVCELVRILGPSQSAVSRHLAILKASDLIGDYRVGKWVFYYLNFNEMNSECAEVIRTLLGWLQDEDVIRRDRQKLTECIKERGRGACPVLDQGVVVPKNSEEHAGSV